MSGVEARPSPGRVGASSSAPRLALLGITKRYPGVTANDRIDLEVLPGEIHAVLGENGAGKSTLMKIIYGAVRPDAGELWWNGERVQVGGPAAARRRGIAMVFQHFALFETLTVAENVWLGVDRRWSRGQTRERLAQVARDHELAVPLDQPVQELSVGERQRVEIVRALLAAPQLLILDEPTSVLTPAAVDRLFATLRRIAAAGCSILYISHKLEEVRALCGRCTVLRAGRVTSVVDPRAETADQLAERMLGAAAPRAAVAGAAGGDVVLDVRGLRLAGRHAGLAASEPAIDLAVRGGEVLGIAGISGNGQAELLAALSGEAGPAPPGTIWLAGHDVSRASVRQRRDLGLRYLPEERMGHGAVPSLSLAANVLLTRREPVGRGGWLRWGVARGLARRLIDRFDVKAQGPDAAARSLSGGNLQKLIVGREIDAAPRALIVAQPTWGLDVGAAARIRDELARLAAGGCAVLVVSEDLEELLEITQRLRVIAHGRLSPCVDTAAATIAQIGAWMGGVGL